MTFLLLVYGYLLFELTLNEECENCLQSFLKQTLISFYFD